MPSSIAIQCVNESLSWLEVLKAAGPIGSWGLVIGGWMFVRNDNNRRQKRKEERDRIDSATTVLREISATSFDYYGKAGSDQAAPALEQKLLGQLSLLRVLLSNLKKIQPIHDHELLHTELWAAVTSGDFQVRSRPALILTNGIYDSIEAAILELLSALEQAYEKGS